MDWLLTAEEQGNPATAIDAEHGDGRAWTVGNHVTVHVDQGRLLRAAAPLLSGLAAGLGVPDRLAHRRHPPAGRPGQLGRCWPDWHGTGWPSAGFCGAPTRPGPLQPGRQPGAEHAGQPSRRAAGSRPAVRRFGSHHRSLVVHLPNDPGRCIAFVGGIDLSAAALTIPTTAATPTRPDRPATGAGRPGDDLQLELHGPAVLDVDLTFRTVEDRTPMDHRNPLRAMWRRVSHEPEAPPARLYRRPPSRSRHCRCCGPTTRHRAIPFAPDGERSVAAPGPGAGRSLVHRGPVPVGVSGLGRARGRLRAAPALRMIIVVPRYPTATGGSRAGPRGPPSGGPSAAWSAPAGRGWPCTTWRTSRDADLRPRQGHRDRRRLGNGGLGQPQPALLDP